MATTNKPCVVKGYLKDIIPISSTFAFEIEPGGETLYGEIHHNISAVNLRRAMRDTLKRKLCEMVYTIQDNGTLMMDSIIIVR